MLMGIGGFAAQSVATKIVAADGSGDFTDIQTAINALPSGGGVVYIKEGTYTITSTITIGVANTAIIGAGRATKIQTTSDITMIQISSKNNCVIENIYLLGAGASALNNLGISVVSSSGTFISHCWIESCGIEQLILSGATSAIVTDNTVTSGGDVGIRLLSSSNSCILDGNVCSSNALFGIRAANCSNLVISNNTVTSNTSTGLQLATVTGSVISGNLCASNGLHGIALVNSSTDNAVAGNVCSSNTGHGISLTGSDYNAITGNVCFGNDSGDTLAFDGISVNTSDENVIASNRCRENDRDELRIDDSGSVSNLVHGNVLIGTDHVAAYVDNGTTTTSADNVTS